MLQKTVVVFLLGAMLSWQSAAAEETPPYRTDENPDPSLPWFHPKPGQFPPEEYAHKISGELIGLDHAERTFVLRVDRDDTQSRALMDRPLAALLLPYGSIYYNNQPAALQDIPLGTHLHGWFYDRPEGEERYWNGEKRTEKGFGDRVTKEADFTQCLRLEDDFSYYARRGQIWKVESVDLSENKLTAVLEEEGKPVGKSKTFDLRSSTTVYRGNGFGTLKEIAPGQRVQMNLTWATLYGPGRIFQIWLDEESQRGAADRQLARHRDHIRERGIPGWVDAVDDKKQIVTISFFDGLDTSLFKDLTVIVPEPLGWPTSGGAKDDLKPKGTIAVARECLMTYDPLNDRKGGNILKITETPVQAGSSGMQIQVECGMLLEGYRPTKIVRFFPASWTVIALPHEEQFFSRE